MFFQTHKGSLQVFRYCSIFKVLCASASRLTACLFYHRSGFLSSIFLKLLNFSELGPLGTSRYQPVFFSVYWFFSKASCQASRSHSFARRLALKYNTTSGFLWQDLFYLFLHPFSSFDFLNSFSPQTQHPFDAALHPFLHFLSIMELQNRLSYRLRAILRLGMPPLCFRSLSSVSAQILLRKSSCNFVKSDKTQNVVVFPLTYH